MSDATSTWVAPEIPAERFLEVRSIPSEFPLDWYWAANDGRIFASGRQALIPADDADHVAWCAKGLTASLWPADGGGTQTDAALQAVLTPYGLFVDLKAYAAAARYAKETGGIKVGSAQIDTSRESQTMIANAYQFMQVSDADSTRYKADSGWVTVTADQLKAIALAVGGHVQACFAIEADMDGKITTGAVTTTADIDAAFATTPA